MPTRPRLFTSIPFWALIVGSLASGVTGAYLLVEKLGGMDARLTDGTATSNDVYVGQIWAILGTILIGAGLIGLALALTLAALRSFAPAGDAVETAPDAEDADDYGYDAELGYEPNESLADEDAETPLTEPEPAPATR